MTKMSELMIALARHGLAQPTEESSREGVAAALLLASVAWNRVVSPDGGDRAGHYHKVLRALQKENPDCLTELKSDDLEAIIEELARVKKVHYGNDNRIIRVCGLTEENKVRVECYVPGSGHEEEHDYHETEESEEDGY